MEAKRVARAGVMTAMLAVSAQVMLPFGPVPSTLQTLVLAMVPAVLDPATSVFTVRAYVVRGAGGVPVFAGFNGAVFTVRAYVVRGAGGVPVFAGFNGGIGALAGPTGWFLWGFVLGCARAGALAKVLDGRIGASPRALGCAAALVLGAVGLPVFAGFNGGIGALAGPTGGFLWGFVLGCALAGALAKVLDGRIGAYPRVLVCAAALVLVSDACGTVQLMALMNLDLAGALAIAVIPFVVPDAVMVAMGARLGCTVGGLVK